MIVFIVTLLFELALCKYAVSILLLITLHIALSFMILTIIKSILDAQDLMKLFLLPTGFFPLLPNLILKSAVY